MEELWRGGLTPPGEIGCQVECLEEVDSTNLRLKTLAGAGAPHGTVVIARTQTGGRGRQGRSFFSPPGQGLYFSALLRPQVDPDRATDLTAWVAVATARAVETACGLAPDIKWVNDLQLQGKKLVGILCEMGLGPQGLEYVVAGIGINVGQGPEDFPPQVAHLATSLAQHLDSPPALATLARALAGELEGLCRDFPHQGEAYLAQYRARCVTLGRPVDIHTPQGVRRAFARGLDDRFRLEVVGSDGRVELLSAGEVSVRAVDKGTGGPYNG